MINNINKVKIIFHIDLNAFFCSVAEIKYPYLKGKAFVIGREGSTKGVIATASYEARKYKIHSAMPVIEGYNILPKLIVVDPDRKSYEEYHKKFIYLIKGYSNLVEVASIDEVYVDMTKKCENIHPYELAKEIQSRLLEEYKLPCSIGIAPTLFLAKMASELKKPLGITILRKREIKDYLYPLSVKEIHGIGKKTYPKLIEEGIKLIGDFVDERNMIKVIHLIGEKNYQHVLSNLNGTSNNIVNPNRYSDNESISTSHTYDIFKDNEEDILFELINQVKEIHKKMMAKDYFAKTISIVLRDSEFKTINRSKTIDYTNDLYEIIDIVTDLLEENIIKGKSYRLLGCGLSNFKTQKELKDEYNLFTFESHIIKDEKISGLIDSFNKKYGSSIIKKGIK